MRIVVRAGRAVGGVTYFEDTPLDVSPNYGAHLVSIGAATDPEATVMPMNPQSVTFRPFDERNVIRDLKEELDQ